MADEVSLEVELERRWTANEDPVGLWPCYQAMKAYLSREYYRWIQANCPYYTDHGDQHIKSVIQAGSGLLSQQLDGTRRNDLTTLDLFLLLSGILWHDVGNVLGRSGHAKRVAEMTEEIKKLGFPDLQVHRLVVEISKAHSGMDGLTIPRVEEHCGKYTVYPKALAAIVRFADEISEDRLRVSGTLLPHIPEHHKIFWEYASCISASRPDPARGRIIITVEVQIDKTMTTFPCKEFPRRSDGAGKIPLIEYLLCRLEKMNNERFYCNQAFARYLSIRELEARFTILKGTERVQGYELTAIFGDYGLSQSAYPDIKIFDEFFRQYPDWRVARLQEALTS